MPCVQRACTCCGLQCYGCSGRCCLAAAAVLGGWRASECVFCFSWCFGSSRCTCQQPLLGCGSRAAVVHCWTQLVALLQLCCSFGLVFCKCSTSSLHASSSKTSAYQLVRLFVVSLFLQGLWMCDWCARCARQGWSGQTWILCYIVILMLLQAGCWAGRGGVTCRACCKELVCFGCSYAEYAARVVWQQCPLPLWP